MAIQRSAMVFTVFVGLLPYIGGGCLAILPPNVLRLVIIGILITLFCTTGAYVIRKRTNAQYAVQWLIIDPFLYGFEFAFTAVLVRYAILGA